jgi:hypothetical protein
VLVVHETILKLEHVVLTVLLFAGAENTDRTSLSRALNGKYLKSSILIFDKTLELEMADNGITALSTKMADGKPWTSPSGQIWSKMHFNMQA